MNSAEPPESSGPSIQKGATFETPSGTYRVRGVRGDTVIFDKQTPSGKTSGVVPREEFQKWILGDTPPKPEDEAELNSEPEGDPEPEDEAELERFEALYEDLSPDERQHIASRWNEESGHQLPDELVIPCRQPRLRARIKKRWVVAAIIAGVVLVVWVRNHFDNYNRGRAALFVLDYLWQRSQNDNPDLKSAMAEAAKKYEEFLEERRAEAAER